MQPEILFYFIVLIYSIILHEIAHGYAAYIFGDKTAFFQNRLTLNPIPHIDPMGSVLIPGLLIISGSSLFFGWARPVPVAEHNLNPFKLGKFCVSFAGVFVNLLLATIFILVGANVDAEDIKKLCSIIAIVNVSLAIFNLIPIPPADGYHIIEEFLPYNLKRKVEAFLQQNFFIAIIIAILIATQIFHYIFPFFQRLILNFIF